jgi:hypothetical protein
MRLTNELFELRDALWKAGVMGPNIDPSVRKPNRSKSRQT